MKPPRHILKPKTPARQRAERARLRTRYSPLEPGHPNIREAWDALRMIRETIETVGPVGALPSDEGVITTRGPTLLDEAEVLVEGIRRIAEGGGATCNTIRQKEERARHQSRLRWATSSLKSKN
jgi:hypothetical protein